MQCFPLSCAAAQFIRKRRADCERGFNLMNAVKTKSRNQLQTDLLEMLMRLKFHQSSHASGRKLTWTKCTSSSSGHHRWTDTWTDVTDDLPWQYCALFNTRGKMGLTLRLWSNIFSLLSWCFSIYSVGNAYASKCAAQTLFYAAQTGKN